MVIHDISVMREDFVRHMWTVRSMVLRTLSQEQRDLIGRRQFDRRDLGALA